ncbi:unnamed protein product, partial [Tetraodon nigroviridis]
LGLLSVVTVCGNVLVIISVVYFKQLHVPTNYLILSLAVADLLVGTMVFPFSMAVTVTACWYQEDLFCKIRGSLDATLSTASILNLCCISVDRYYAVCQPLTYKSKINDRIIGVMILGSWGVSATIGIGIIVAGFNQGKCEGSCLIDAFISTTLGCVFSFYIPVIIMLSIYLKIYLVAQKQAKNILRTNCQKAKPAAIANPLTQATRLGVISSRPVSKKRSSTACPAGSTAIWTLPRRLKALQSDLPAKPLPPTSIGRHLARHPSLRQSSTSSAYFSPFLSYASSILSSQDTVSSSKITCLDDSIASKTERKATKTLAIVLGVFILCWTPYFLCIVFQPLTYKVTPISVIEALNWLTLSNSMLNPFIYAFFYSWFRSAFRIIIS